MLKKPKVTLITLSLSERDGAGRYSVNLIKGLAKKCILTVFAPKDTEVDESLVELPQCDIHCVLPSLSFRRNVLASPYYALKVSMLSRKADIIHSLFGFPHSFLAALVSLLLSKPLVVSALGTYSILPLTMPVYGGLLKWTFRRAKKVLCISRFTEKEILRAMRLENTIVVPMGVDYDRFQVCFEEAKEEKIILSVGAVKARKGFDVLIKAMSELKKEGLNVRCYIVGDTSNSGYYENLIRLTKMEEVQDMVNFLGPVSSDDLIKWYHRSDVFALTPKNIGKHYEGFGIVYLEANACGKPVVGTLNCGAEEPIIDGYNGLLVPQDDVKAVTEAINYLLSNPSAAKEMGENGRKRAKKMSWAETADRTIREYKAVLGDF